MASLDSLPGDQRAVLQLVLGRGRSYDEIARLLSINPEAVRERALAALDMLGPQTRVSDDDRQMICDYLLGQLPESEIPTVRDRLAHAAAERAWARVLSSELAPMASGPLPEIPLDTGPPPAPAVAAAAPTTAPPAAAAAAPTAPPVPDPVPLVTGAGDGGEDSAPRRGRFRRAPKAPKAAAAPRARRARRSAPTAAASTAADSDGPRSSRRGGMVVIGLAVIVIIVVLVLVLHHGGSGHSHTVASSSSQTTAASQSSSSSSTTGTTGSADVISQINLTPPQAGSKALGIAEVIQQGSTRELAIVGQNIPANTSTNSYEVWLYNSASDAYSLGFVNPGVTATGKQADRFTSAAPLPSTAGNYKELIVTTETRADGQPKTPGPILLQGTITGLS